MIVYAVLLTMGAALFDYFLEIKEPWRKLVYAGCVICLIIGVLAYFFPGFPARV